VAVEAERVYDFSDEMTPAVETAVPEAVQLVLEMLQEIETELREPVGQVAG
jgi:hypothetical protein